MIIFDGGDFRKRYLREVGSYTDLSLLLEDPEAMAQVVDVISDFKGGNAPPLRLTPEQFMERYIMVNRRRRKRPYDLSRLREDPVAIAAVARDITSRFDISPQTQREYLSEFEDPYATPDSLDLPKTEESEKHSRVHKIAGIGSEGSVIASIVSFAMQIRYVPIADEKGRLAGDDVVERDYINKNGKHRTMEVRRSSITGTRGRKILIVEDILSSGITATEGVKLIGQAGGDVVGVYAVVVDESKGGLKKLRKAGVNVDYIVKI